MQVFFGHPKGWDDELIEAAVNEIAQSMQKDLGHPIEVVSGRDDFIQNIASEGNFNGWCRSITRRRNTAGEKLYQLILVPKTEGIGKATAMIIQDALDADLPVAEVEFTDTGITVRSIIDINARDEEDFVSGWEVFTSDT